MTIYDIEYRKNICSTEKYKRSFLKTVPIKPDLVMFCNTINFLLRYFIIDILILFRVQFIFYSFKLFTRYNNFVVQVQGTFLIFNIMPVSLFTFFIDKLLLPVFTDAENVVQGLTLKIQPFIFGFLLVFQNLVT